jgi:hypothetical protein
VKDAGTGHAATCEWVLVTVLYGEGMARFVSTTVRLDEEDVRALKRARAAGISSSDLIRKGLRVVAAALHAAVRVHQQQARR